MNQQSALAAAVGREVRITPARLDVTMPFELPQAQRDAIAETMAGEAWLQRLGLEGLLTGIAGSDVKTFRASVERLAGMLRYARQQGKAEAEALSTVQAADGRWHAHQRVGLAALVGVGAGVLFGALLF